MNLTDMRAFVVVWIGQFLSRVGSFVTGFALAGLCGYLFKATREAETLLPDHTQDYAVKKVSRT